MPNSADSHAIAEKLKAEGNAAYQKQKWAAAAEVSTLTALKSTSRTDVALGRETQVLPLCCYTCHSPVGPFIWLRCTLVKRSDTQRPSQWHQTGQCFLSTGPCARSTGRGGTMSSQTAEGLSRSTLAA